MLLSYFALQGRVEMVLRTQALAIQEKLTSQMQLSPHSSRVTPWLQACSFSVNCSPSFLAGLGEVEEGRKSRCQHTSGSGLKAEEYMLLVPDQMEGWEQKQHPTNLKMDAGAGAVNSQLSGRRSLSRSDAGSEEATFVSHFVLLYFSCSPPCCYDESCLQIIASILFSSMKNQAHTTLVQKGSGSHSSFSDNKLVHM